MTRPQRLMAVAILITTVGNGLYLACAVLFLTRSVGLPVAQVGVGLTVAGALGLLAGIPLGRLADIYGPRQVYLATVVAEGVTIAAFAMVHSFPAFLLVAGLAGVAEQSSRAVRGALIAQVGGAQRTAFRAYLRAVTNVGFSVGTLAAGLAIHVGTRTAYLTLILGDAVSFLLTALVVARLPRIAPEPPPAGGPRWVALRDRGYLAVALLYGVLAIQYQVLTVVLPLWIVRHTHAPVWLISPLLLTNTVLVVFLQVRAGRGVRGLPEAVTITRRAGAVLVVSCVLFAAAGGLPVGLSVPTLFAAVAVHTLGEMWYAVASFEVGFGLAAPWAQGEYQGVFGLGSGGIMALAPIVLITLCVSWGWPGWLVLGCLLFAAAMAAAAATTWAAARRDGSAQVAVATESLES